MDRDFSNFQIHLSILFRFDTSEVELMKWYEAIFGDDIWRHLVIETSFWQHSEEEAKKRKLKRHV